MLTNFPFKATVPAAALGACMIIASANAWAASDSASTSAPSSTASASHAPLPAGVVATVNNVPIMQSEIDQLIAQTKAADTPTARTNFKNELIARELFRQAAEQKHYDTRPEVQQAMQTAKVNAESQLFLRDAIHATPVSDADVKARFDEIVSGLGKTEYKPRVIEVADDATAATVLAQLKAGATFDALAKQYSLAPNKLAGGELPWVSFKLPLVEGKTQGLPLAMAEAIVQQPIGAVTPKPLVINGARFIIKVDEARPTQIPTFDQAKATIRAALEKAELQKAAAAVTVNLVKNAQIQQ